MKTTTTENQSGLPLTAIVTLIEYLVPSEEFEHMEQMKRDGEDITDPPHIYLSIKAVTDWLMTHNPADAHYLDLRYHLLEAFYIADAWFASSPAARDAALTKIDDALISRDPVRMKCVLNLAVKAIEDDDASVLINEQEAAMSNTTMPKLEWKPGYTCFFFAALTDGSEYRIFGCYGSADYRACYFPTVVTRDLVQLGTAKTIEETKALCEQHFNRGSVS